jgi:hypothetical protein
MKTARFALMLALMSFALVGFTNVNYGPASVVVKISLENASNDRGLAMAMYRQLDQAFLNVEHEGFYFVKVQHKNITFMIFGTYKDWKKFFFTKRMITEKNPTLL